MRLGISLPPSWPRRFEGNRLLIAVAPDLALEIGRLGPFDEIPENPHRLGVPKDCTLRIEETSELRTIGGWPMRVVVSTLEREAAFVEARIDALYKILVYGALVRVHAQSRDGFLTERSSLVELLASAQPSLRRGRVAGVHDLWDMDTSDEYG